MFLSMFVKKGIVSVKHCVTLFLLHPYTVPCHGNEVMQSNATFREVFFSQTGGNRQTDFPASSKFVIENWFWGTGEGFYVFLSRAFYIWIEMRLFPSLLSKVLVFVLFFF